MQADSENAESKENGNATGFVVEPTSDRHFSWIQARLSADSMLMGWMSLATTLIGFGFAIVQFFDRLDEKRQTRTCSTIVSVCGIGADFFWGLRSSRRHLAVHLVC